MQNGSAGSGGIPPEVALRIAERAVSITLYEVERRQDERDVDADLIAAVAGHPGSTTKDIIASAKVRKQAGSLRLKALASSGRLSAVHTPGGPVLWYLPGDESGEFRSRFPVPDRKEPGT